MKKRLLLIVLLALVSCSSNGGKKPEGNSSSVSTGEGSTSVVVEKPQYVTELTPTDYDYVHYLGRYLETGSKVSFSYSCSGFEVKYSATEAANSLTINVTSHLSGHDSQFVTINIDGEEDKVMMTEVTQDIKLCENLSVGDHTIKFQKCNEASFSKVILNSLTLVGAKVEKYGDNGKKKLEFYGDSITCGYGNLTDNSHSFSTATEDGLKAYTQLTADALDFENSVVSYSGIALAKSPFGQTFTMMDKYKTVDGTNEWDFNKYKPDYIVINLGTNDNTALREVLNNENERDDILKTFRNNLQDMIMDLKEKSLNAKVIVAANMMLEVNSLLSLVMEAVVNEVNGCYDEFAYYLEFTPNYGGADGHPSQEGHINAANKLAQFINELER